MMVGPMTQEQRFLRRRRNISSIHWLHQVGALGFAKGVGVQAGWAKFVDDGALKQLKATLRRLDITTN